MPPIGNAPEIPKFAVIVSEDENGKPFAGLQITSRFTLQQFYLCDASNFRKVAQVMHDTIIQAGRDMLARQNGGTSKTGLTVAKGVNSDGLRAESRQQQRPRR